MLCYDDVNNVEPACKGGRGQEIWDIYSPKAKLTILAAMCAFKNVYMPLECVDDVGKLYILTN